MKNDLLDFEGIKHKVITRVETSLGYMQVLEYILQDKSFLHVIQWHFINFKDGENLLPNINCQTFYREKDKALDFAHQIGNNLLQQYLIS